MSKALVLLSGGIDSSTCLGIAMRDFGDATAVSINYGQRHAKEIEHAKKVAARYHVEHITHALGPQPQSMLTNPHAEVPHKRYSDFTGVSPTYVPFRNGQLLSAIAALAQDSADCEAIYFGAHAEDAQDWAYPDCTPEFIGAMANAIYIGTYHKVRLHTPLQWLRKSEIVAWGTELGVPYHLTWSCYKGEELHCGQCPTCHARHEGFEIAGIPDPTLYAMSLTPTPPTPPTAA